MAKPPEALTTTQIAAECGISAQTVRRDMDSGKLAHSRYRSRRISTRDQVDDYRRRCLVEGPRESRPLHPDFRPGGAYG